MQWFILRGFYSDFKSSWIMFRRDLKSVNNMWNRNKLCLCCCYLVLRISTHNNNKHAYASLYGLDHNNLLKTFPFSIRFILSPDFNIQPSFYKTSSGFCRTFKFLFFKVLEINSRTFWYLYRVTKRVRNN